MESSKLMYLCAAESRGPRCAWDTHKQSSRELPLRGHYGDKTRTGDKTGGTRTVQSCVCLGILVSLGGVLRRYTNVCSIIQSVRKSPQNLDLVS